MLFQFCVFSSVCISFPPNAKYEKIYFTFYRINSCHAFDFEISIFVLFRVLFAGCSFFFALVLTPDTRLFVVKWKKIHIQRHIHRAGIPKPPKPIAHTKESVENYIRRSLPLKIVCALHSAITSKQLAMLQFFVSLSLSFLCFYWIISNYFHLTREQSTHRKSILCVVDFVVVVVAFIQPSSNW